MPIRTRSARQRGKQKAWRLGAIVARHSMREMDGGWQPGMLGKPTLTVMGQALRRTPRALVLQMADCEATARQLSRSRVAP